MAALFFLTAIHAQNVGIGTTTPGFPLNFANTLGDKISLWGNSGNHFGFGIQTSLLQIHTDAPGSNIAFGHGSSSNFTERMKILNNGNYDGMSLNGRLVLRNGSADLVGGGPGVWLYRADNTGALGFMGAQNNQNVGFFGGSVNGGWGFVYDAVNGRIGIGTSSPTAPLSFPASLGKKITLYPGATGDAGIGVFGNELRIASDYINADVTVGYDNTSFGFTERMRIKGNGNVGIGNNNPVNKLDVNGSINLTGSLKISGNTGTAGQVLQSNGNNAPVWKAKPYFLTLQQGTSIQLIGIGVYSLPIPGLENQTILIPEASKVSVTVTGTFVPTGLPTVSSGRIWIEIWETSTNTMKLRLLANGYANGYDGATLQSTNLVDLNAGLHMVRAYFKRTHDTFSGDSRLYDAKLIMEVFPN